MIVPFFLDLRPSKGDSTWEYIFGSKVISIAVSICSLDRWDRWYIITQLAGTIPLIYTTYIPCQLLDYIYIYHRSHLLREPFGFTPLDKNVEVSHCKTPFSPSNEWLMVVEAAADLQDTWVLQRRLCLKTRWSWRFRSLVFCRGEILAGPDLLKDFSGRWISRFFATFVLVIFSFSSCVHAFNTSQVLELFRYPKIYLKWQPMVVFSSFSWIRIRSN